MPVISTFYGILIKMYYDDHNPPHFHAYYSDYEAIFSFDGELIKREFPKKQLKLVEAWSIIHIEDFSMLLINRCINFSKEKNIYELIRG